MELNQLKTKLQEIESQSLEANWLESLEPRKKIELEFHNKNRDTSLIQELPQDTYELLHGNKKFYSTIELSRRYVDHWLVQNVPGRVFLDYACGNGNMAIQAAQFGASLAIGLDISDVSVQNARLAAAKLGLKHLCLFLQGDCEKTGLPDNSIDVILCSGMLHHLDLNHAFPELRRILKPGGRILAVEALNYNPIIKLYRNRTPSMRTDWEKNHILSLKDLKHAKKYFKIGEVRYWHLFSVLGAYIRGENSFTIGVKRMLNHIDSFLLRIPGLQLMSWQFTFELIKEDSEV